MRFSTRKGDSYTLPFTKFPGYGSHKKGYAYVVCSVDGHGKRTCTTLKDSFYVHSEGHGVSTSDLHKAAAKISSCLGTGENAAVVTAAESGSVLAAATWIPGVNGITAADVGAAAAGQGGYKFATCLLDW